MALSIGVLTAGLPPDSLVDRYPSYGTMLVDFLTPHGKDLTFVSYDVFRGHFPESVQDHDAWIISGSKHSVYDDLPWITQLKNWVVAIAASGSPLVGICFGHQMLAHALGGRVEKYAGGWGVGTETYQLTPALAETLHRSSDQPLILNAIHQDQVVAIPAGAEVLGHSAFCAHAVVDFCEGKILGIQAHPEFSSAFEIELLDACRGDAMAADVADLGLKKVQERGGRVDNSTVGQWVASILQGRV